MMAFEISLLALSDEQASKRCITAHSVFLAIDKNQTMRLSVLLEFWHWELRG
jgi:hypothetical protein